MNELCKMCAYEHSDCKGNKEYTSFKCDYYKKPQVFNAKQAAERIAELRWLLDDTLDKYFSLLGRTIKQEEETAERVGEWIYHIDDLFPEESTQECSLCHKHEYIKLNNENYCPNCGARMEDE